MFWKKEKEETAPLSPEDQDGLIDVARQYKRQWAELWADPEHRKLMAEIFKPNGVDERSLANLAAEVSKLQASLDLIRRGSLKIVHDENFNSVAFFNLDGGKLPVGLFSNEGLALKAKSLADANESLQNLANSHWHLAETLRAQNIDLRGNYEAVAGQNALLLGKIAKLEAELKKARKKPATKKK